MTNNELILLLIMDRMDFPMREDIISDICYYKNNWLEYTDCIQAVSLLQDKGFIDKTVCDNIAYYSITSKGREEYFINYFQLSTEITANIIKYVSENRLKCKREQNYGISYTLNQERIYTCNLKLYDSLKKLLDVKVNANDKEIANKVMRKWESVADEVYSLIVD